MAPWQVTGAGDDAADPPDHLAIRAESGGLFPDRIVLSCPERLPLHQSFSVAVRWLSGDGRLQIIRAAAAAGARLTGLQHQVLRRAPRQAVSGG